jgi:hypothetical protein
MVHWSELTYILTEIVVIILYATCTEYGEGVHPAATSTAVAAGTKADTVQRYYPLF